MYFLLKSEVESIDIQRNYLKKRIYCPFCYKTQLKKLDSNNYYNKYQCWNKNCEEKGVPFIVLNKYIQNEDSFDDMCDSCQEHYNREFRINDKEKFLLYFKCNGKLCDSNIEAYCYNFSIDDWEGNPPKIVLYAKPSSSIQLKTERIKKIKEKIQKIEEQQEDLIGSLSKDFQEEIPGIIYRIEDIPLLTMNSIDYGNFLDNHQDKVVVLVDVPNFIRTLRNLFPRNFESVVKKAHKLLLEYIENSFYTSSDYIIRYFSKPDKDLQVPNNLIIKFCSSNPKKEIFHLLKIMKGAGYSDIDNYLIANGVEILERCTIRGFIIVSSDKDYLPVMRIAGYKKVKSQILGINTPEIYEKYNIEDIKFLGIMKFFDNKNRL